MPEARVCACSGHVWPRPDGDDATPTRKALLPIAEVAGPKPKDTRACALRRPSTSREPSSSLENLQAVCTLRFLQSPLLRGFDVHPFSPDGGQEGVSEGREGYVTVPAIPASHFVVSQSYLSFGFLKSDLHPPAAAGHLRQRFKRGVLGTEDRIGAEVFRVLDGAAHQKPSLKAFLHGRVERQPQPVVEPGTFGALSGREALPTFIFFGGLCEWKLSLC